MSPRPLQQRIGIRTTAAILVSLALTACAASPRYRGGPEGGPGEGKRVENLPPDETNGAARVEVPTKGAYQVGMASYYAHKFHGRPTASGVIFDMHGLSAAHRELPLGTQIRVTHLGNGRSVDLVVNDRGPFIPGRVLDLSLGAARRLDMVEEGVARVKIEVLSLPE